MDPAQSIGFVDLETLVKMYEQLLQSLQEDDNELATYIRKEYLPVGFDEDTKGGVPIQGKESFTKLYNAYKRVRNLTGRVQDKWPFFDRRSKAINKNIAIKIAAGEDNTPSADTPDNNLSGPSSAVDTAGTNVATMASMTPQPESSVPFTSVETTEMVESKGVTAEDLKVTQELDSSTMRTTLSLSPATTEAAPSAMQSRSDETEHISDTFVQPTLASALAVEAEPERSNLDDLPTTLGQKRKHIPDFDNNGRFAAGHRGLNKRSRGTGKSARGGRGRGRKKRSFGVEHDDLKNNSGDHTPPTFNGVDSVEKPDVSPPSPRVTRQQKRLSGGSDNYTTSSHESCAVSQKLDTRKSRVDSNDTAVGEQMTTPPSNIKGAAASESDSATTEPTETELIILGISHFDTPQTSPAMPPKVDRRTKKSEMMAAANEEQDNPESGSLDPGAVEIIARVRTKEGFHDITLPASVIQDKELHELLFRYASWTEKMGDKAKSVDFEMWRNIHTW